MIVVGIENDEIALFANFDTSNTVGSLKGGNSKLPMVKATGFTSNASPRPGNSTCVIKRPPKIYSWGSITDKAQRLSSSCSSSLALTCSKVTSAALSI